MENTRRAGPRHLSLPGRFDPRFRAGDSVADTRWPGSAATLPARHWKGEFQHAGHDTRQRFVPPGRREKEETMQAITHTAALQLARLTRRALTRLSRRSVTAGVYLREAGVDVDRLTA